MPLPQMVNGLTDANRMHPQPTTPAAAGVQGRSGLLEGALARLQAQRQGGPGRGIATDPGTAGGGIRGMLPGILERFRSQFPGLPGQGGGGARPGSPMGGVHTMGGAIPPLMGFPKPPAGPSPFGPGWEGGGGPPINHVPFDGAFDPPGNPMPPGMTINPKPPGGGMSIPQIPSRPPMARPPAPAAPAPRRVLPKGVTVGGRSY